MPGGLWHARLVSGCRCEGDVVAKGLEPADQVAGPAGGVDEVARLEAHGAKRVDIGQGEQSWVVMADPEGNEFCVLGQRQQRIP